MSAIIPLALRPVTPELPAPGPCPGCNAHAWHQHGGRARRIQDRDRTTVAVPRDRCQACGRTLTVKPEGVDRTDRSRPLQALIGVLYSLGLSLRSLAWMRSWFGYPVSHVTCGRDIPRLGAAVCPQGPAPGASVSAVYRDETYIKVRGRARPVAAVMDLQGDMLRLQVRDENWDWGAWLAPLGDWGVEVVVTDDAPAYGPPRAGLGLRRQQCMVHMLRTFHRAVRRMAPAMRKRYADRLQALLQLLQTLPADGETQLRLWLDEAVAAPHRGPRSAWRRLVLHMWERGKEMTVHLQRPGVPPDTHRLEGRFGRVKPRDARLPQPGRGPACAGAPGGRVGVRPRRAPGHGGRGAARVVSPHAPLSLPRPNPTTVVTVP